MIVFYRICSIPSTNPPPIFAEDKFELNKLCLKSFVETFKEIKPTVHFLADFCGAREEEMIKQICPFQYTFIPTSIGINATALLQWDMASKIEDGEEIILFNECDHLWRENVGKYFVEAIKNLDIVSPFDHPDFYSRFDIHPKQTEIVLVNNYHFRKSARNVMTWGTKAKVIKENKDILDYYGYLDDKVWEELRSRGYQLWTPLPSMDTHMTRDFMAPSINWQEEWEKYL